MGHILRIMGGRQVLLLAIIVGVLAILMEQLSISVPVRTRSYLSQNPAEMEEGLLYGNLLSIEWSAYSLTIPLLHCHPDWPS